jgi:hypothetical protein
MALTMTAGSAVSRATARRLRQSARLSRRDRAVAARIAHRRLPRARLQGDDPDHPSRPPHRLEQGRLAAGAGRLAGARARPPRLPQGDAEDWDIDRIVADYADAAQRMQAAGLDGIEFEAYGHLMDGSGRPPPTIATTIMAARSTTACASPTACHRCRARRRRPDFLVGIRMVADEDWDKGLTRDRASRSLGATRRRRQDRLPQHHPRPHRDTTRR